MGTLSAKTHLRKAFAFPWIWSGWSVGRKPFEYKVKSVFFHSFGYGSESDHCLPLPVSGQLLLLRLDWCEPARGWCQLKRCWWNCLQSRLLLMTTDWRQIENLMTSLKWFLDSFKTISQFHVRNIKFLAIFDVFFAKESVKTYWDTIFALLRGILLKRWLLSHSHCPND